MEQTEEQGSGMQAADMQVADMPAADMQVADMQAAVEPTGMLAAGMLTAVAENNHPAVVHPQDGDQGALAHLQQSL